MTNEELDRARAQEARRIFDEAPSGVPGHVATIAARLAREGWTPPEPVDPDVLAFREWAATAWPLGSEAALRGHMDTTQYAEAYLAGARMAREQEQERAEVLVEYVRGRLLVDLKAQIALKAYERAAR
jgi:hypothetical protein